ncbi:hypothetical protein GC177_07010 [bacterium]|nr:hypothetical protein [bacterium]
MQQVNWGGSAGIIGGEHDKTTDGLTICVAIAAILYDDPAHFGNPDHIESTALVHFFAEEAGYVQSFFNTLSGMDEDPLKLGDQRYLFTLTHADGTIFAPERTALFLAGSVATDKNDAGLGLVNLIKELCNHYGYRIYGEVIGGLENVKSLSIHQHNVTCHVQPDLPEENPLQHLISLLRTRHLHAEFDMTARLEYPMLIKAGFGTIHDGKLTRITQDAMPQADKALLSLLHSLNKEHHFAATV